MERYRGLPCVVCESTETTADHVKTKGSGGPDKEWNLMPLCFFCHEEKGRVNIRVMAERYLQYRNWLKNHGWTQDHEGKWRYYEEV